MSDEERYKMGHPWKGRVFYVEWRTEDQINVKIYDQRQTVECADYKVGLFHTSSFDLCRGRTGDHEAGEKEIQLSAKMTTGKYLCKSDYNRYSELAIRSTRGFYSAEYWLC